MKKIAVVIICLISAAGARAQNAHFTTSGTIVFEKRINTYALLKKRINKNNGVFMQQIYDNYRKTQPQFKTLKSVLTFTKNKTLFKPVEDDAPITNYYIAQDPLVEQYNNTFTDLVTGISTTQKKVFEQTFLVKDSTRTINWKITDETREIAGYTCRRANAIILDSVYVVAFYTNKIIVPGGPESFTGLPGMILGLALPHDNITWFATKVTDMQILPDNVLPPSKGKPVNNKQLKVQIAEFVKDKGTDGRSYLKAELL